METRYGNPSPIFEDERYLLEDYTPETLPERTEQLDELYNALEPASRGIGAQNVFLYGKAGQGKSATAKVELGQLQHYAEHEANDLDLTVVELSCEDLAGSYQVTCRIVKELTGEHPNGHPTDVVFEKLWDALNEVGGSIILVLDEIDNIGTNDQLLYALPRARDKEYVNDNVFPSILGISNDLQWRDHLSPKVKDSLYDESVFFPPYDANQLRKILSRRAVKAFNDTEAITETVDDEEVVVGVESDVLTEDVIPLAAAFAAQDTGSARQAIRYLRKAGRLASSAGDEAVTEEHLREAQNQAERERVVEGMEALTTQGHLTLAAVTALEFAGEAPATTREVYQVYRQIAEDIDADPLVMRRMREHLQELDMLGIIQLDSKAAGSPGGPTYHAQLRVDKETAREVLSRQSRVADAGDLDTYVSPRQQKL
ncbi:MULTISPECIES: orc1/cdc6 family replication initiation protein [unclassified Haloferax]|jgi:cell division control protein 6|uniref:Cdc6/Cdc18 family protein n=1 Tax=unclassified Haloferax TaxID=2625095 RepID=UPI002876CEBE|nr:MULTISPECIES: orc1/cdc6 family replication initiation protein [unclassified Haloferax]MDS0243136.1 orc1/cdc6 family replication initiation protein [Haloferax sp. S2CR25]MDS0446257.1 orc1/cdc6 family replication initiation protein [Haloferax sp. S2CR25-2]